MASGTDWAFRFALFPNGDLLNSRASVGGTGLSRVHVAPRRPLYPERESGGWRPQDQGRQHFPQSSACSQLVCTLPGASLGPPLAWACGWAGGSRPHSLGPPPHPGPGVSLPLMGPPYSWGHSAPPTLPKPPGGASAQRGPSGLQALPHQPMAWSPLGPRVLTCRRGTAGLMLGALGCPVMCVRRPHRGTTVNHARWCKRVARRQLPLGSNPSAVVAAVTEVPPPAGARGHTLSHVSP